MAANRHEIGTLAAWALGLAASLFTAAQALGAQPGAGQYPSRPVRLVIPFAPGGGSDVLARLIGPRLADRLGQPVVVDNRPAAAGVVGADIVAKGPADGGAGSARPGAWMRPGSEP